MTHLLGDQSMVWYRNCACWSRRVGTDVISLSGTLSPDEFRHILTHFGEIMEPSEVEEFVTEADLKSPHLRSD